MVFDVWRRECGAFHSLLTDRKIDRLAATGDKVHYFSTFKRLEAAHDLVSVMQLKQLCVRLRNTTFIVSWS